MDDETRSYWKARYPEATDERIELIGCMIFSHESCKRMATAGEWLKDPETLLADLRIIEEWRVELISDNPVNVEEEYAFTIHREKNILFTLLKSTIQDMIVNLRAANVASGLPVCPDRLEAFARTLEAVQCGSNDPQSVYELWRILNQEIRTMEVFCRLNRRNVPPAGVLYSMADLCEMIGVEASKTVQNYLRAVGLPTCGRGQSRTFRLDREQAIQFLNQVYSLPTISAHRDEARKSLNRLNPLN